MWSSFRLAVNALIITQVAVVLLSARGVTWFESASFAPKAARITGGVLGLLLLMAIVLMVAPGGWRDAAIAARPAMSLAAAAESARHAAGDLALHVVLALVALASLALLRSRAAGWVSALPLALMVFDLAVVDVPYLRRATGDLTWLEHPRPPGSAVLAAREPRQRGLDPARGRFFANDWIRWKARSVGGNHPAVNRAWDDFLKRELFMSAPVLRALAVKYVSVGPGELDPAWFERLRAGPEGGLWQVKRALPRAYAVPEVRSAGSEVDVLGALADPRFDASTVAWTPDERVTGSYAGSTECRIRWIDDEPDHIALATDAPGPSFVVIADAWFPGWSATLDGHPLDIARVDHLVRGVAVPEGAHRIAMRYVPEGWPVAEAVTRLALLVWVACGLTWLAWVFAARRAVSAKRPERLPDPRPAC